MILRSEMMLKEQYELKFKYNYSWVFTVLLIIILNILIALFSLATYARITVWVLMGIVMVYQINIFTKPIVKNMKKIKALKIDKSTLEVNRAAFLTYENDLIIDVKSITDCKIIIVRKRFTKYGIGITFTHKSESINIVLADVFNEQLDKVHKKLCEYASIKQETNDIE